MPRNDERISDIILQNTQKEVSHMIKLSVLDQSPVSSGTTQAEAIQQTVILAQTAEKLGYHRYWIAEHHSMNSLASSSPEVLISHVAAKTSTIRVGSGGVLLPHYSAYKVAENFRMLEALYPNRIDLGIGRAPGGSMQTSMALQNNNPVDINRFPEQLADLVGFLQHHLPDNHRFSEVKATPLGSTAPEIWLLGSSGTSAIYGAQMGAAFTYAHFINPYDGVAAIRSYTQRFTPSDLNAKPKASIAVVVICAETEEEAEALALSRGLWKLKRGQDIEVPTVEEAQRYPYTQWDLQFLKEYRESMIIGNPEQVKEKIINYSKLYHTDEFIILTMTHDFKARIRSYELLAQAFCN